MPTYEYECTRGCQFEVQQSIKDDAFATCQKAFCPEGRGGVKVKRLISAARFILKGGGWYSDGYGSRSGSSSGDSSKSESSKTESSSSSSSSGTTDTSS